MTRPITKILVANRGEVAVRVIRTAREMGIRTVAVYSPQDRASLACDLADEAYALAQGEESSTLQQTYLNASALVDIALKSGADAVHPGYGFLSEDADFAAQVQEAGLIWIGPNSAAIRALGDKISARRIALENNVPVIPGQELPQNRDSAHATAKEIADTHGYPVLLKRADSGGGRGITRCDDPETLQRFFADLPGDEALNGCFIEKMVLHARHVETQCMRDSFGNFAVVSTRDCSVQRRNQKVVEEAPAPHLSEETLQHLRDYSQALFHAVNYQGVGTCEFLVTRDGHVYFLEVNPRLQVEHTVSEEITGLDLVEQQIHIANGEELPTVPQVRGHSIEVRITSENPADDLMPATGSIQAIDWPGGHGVRIDSFIRAGEAIGSDYDSLIAKIIVTAPTRRQTLSKLLRAIEELRVAGLPTCTPLIRHIITHPDFCGPDAPTTGKPWPSVTSDFDVYTKWMEDTNLLAHVKEELQETGAAQQGATRAESAESGVESFLIEINGQRTRLSLPQALLNRMGSPAVPTQASPLAPRPQALRGRGRAKAANAQTGGATPAVTAPIQATVVRIPVEIGATVAEGDLVVVLESMKMEKPVYAQASGTVSGIHISVGDSVKAGQKMIDIDVNTQEEQQ